MLSVIIPSREEKFLNATVFDVLSKARGEIEVIVVLDGYDEERIVGVRYCHHPKPLGMRVSIVEAVSLARGEWIMKLDAHCIVDEGFDVKLTSTCEDNMVMIPRRYKLNVEKWQVDKNTWIDYEHFIYPLKYTPVSLHGFRWDWRKEDRKYVMIDDNLTFQGSCYVMKKSHWDRHKFLTDTGYQGVPQQEAEEIGLTTWLSGGRVVTNKNTWYAHLFKGKMGRGYHLDLKHSRECYAYSYNKWVIENKEGLINLIEKFSPVPGWPSDWKTKLYE